MTSDGGAGVEPVGAGVEVVLECNGWQRENVDVGVFVSGYRSDGSEFAEQVLFAGPGRRTVYVPPGTYEVVSQLPQLMLVGGGVLVVGGCMPVEVGEEEVQPRVVTLTYEPASLEDLSNDELDALAQASFRDSTDAPTDECADGSHDAPTDELANESIDDSAGEPTDESTGEPTDDSKMKNEVA